MKYNFVHHLRWILGMLIVGLLLGIFLSFSIPSVEVMQDALAKEGVAYTIEEIKEFVKTFRLLYLLVLPISLSGIANGLFVYWDYIKTRRTWIIVSIIMWIPVLLGCWALGSIFLVPVIAYDVLAIFQTRGEQ